MAAKADYYEVLGVARTADEKTLKSAFRKLAMQFHPDRNPGDDTAEVKFKEVNEAYECLKDPQKRAAYDRFGHAAFENGGGGPAGFNGDFASSMSDIFDDIFGDIMGGAGAAPAAAAASAAPTSATTWRSRWRRPTPARPPRSRCRPRSPARPAPAPAPSPARSPKTCPTCDGHGRVRSAQGFFSIERTCPTCQGRG